MLGSRGTETTTKSIGSKGHKESWFSTAVLISIRLPTSRRRLFPRRAHRVHRHVLHHAFIAQLHAVSRLLSMKWCLKRLQTMRTMLTRPLRQGPSPSAAGTAGGVGPLLQSVAMAGPAAAISQPAAVQHSVTGSCSTSTVCAQCVAGLQGLVEGRTSA